MSVDLRVDAHFFLAGEKSMKFMIAALSGFAILVFFVALIWTIRMEINNHKSIHPYRALEADDIFRSESMSCKIWRADDKQFWVCDNGCRYFGYPKAFNPCDSKQ